VSFVTPDGRTLTTSSDILIKPPTADYSPEDPTVINWTLQDARWGDSGGSYVDTDLESLEDSFRVESRQAITNTIAPLTATPMQPTIRISQSGGPFVNSRTGQLPTSVHWPERFYGFHFR